MFNVLARVWLCALAKPKQVRERVGGLTKLHKRRILLCNYLSLFTNYFPATYPRRKMDSAEFHAAVMSSVLSSGTYLRASK